MRCAESVCLYYGLRVCGQKYVVVMLRISQGLLSYSIKQVSNPRTVLFFDLAVCPYTSSIPLDFGLIQYTSLQECLNVDGYTSMGVGSGGHVRLWPSPGF